MVRRRVAVQRAGRGGGARAGEVEIVVIEPGAGGQADRVGAELEIQPVGAPGGTEPPLLASIADRQLCDRRAGVVGEAGSDRGNQASALEPAKRALRAGG